MPISDSIPKQPASRQTQFWPDAEDGPPVWRPIHYLGSKLRLVDAIRSRLDELDPSGGGVCDLFAGSGTVSLALSRERTVVAADIQEYSRVLCSAILQPGNLSGDAISGFRESVSAKHRDLAPCLAPLVEYEEEALARSPHDPSPLCDLIEHGSLLSGKSARGRLGLALTETAARIERYPSSFLATRYFGGAYFSFRQALYLDCVLDTIGQLPAPDRDTYLATLLSTASDLVNSVGKQFAQPLRPRKADGLVKQHLISQISRDRCLSPERTLAGWLTRYGELPQGGRHKAVRADYREALADLKDVSVIYADPPYTRDHYSRFYHVLETLCLRDHPTVSTTTIRRKGGLSRGLYRTDRHQSPFCIKRQAPQAFADLFHGSRKLGVPLLLSYSPYLRNGHPRLMTVEAIVSSAHEHYRAVEVTSASDVTHSKLNRTDLHLAASANAEVFIMCRP